MRCKLLKNVFSVRSPIDWHRNRSEIVRRGFVNVVQSASQQGHCVKSLDTKWMASRQTHSQTKSSRILKTHRSMKAPRASCLQRFEESGSDPPASQATPWELDDIRCGCFSLYTELFRKKLAKIWTHLSFINSKIPLELCELCGLCELCEFAKKNVKS